jgi:hypothetical protein
MTDQNKVDTKPGEKAKEEPKPNLPAKKPKTLMVRNHAEKN